MIYIDLLHFVAILMQNNKGTLPAGSPAVFFPRYLVEEPLLLQPVPDKLQSPGGNFPPQTSPNVFCVWDLYIYIYNYIHMHM